MPKYTITYKSGRTETLHRTGIQAKRLEVDLKKAEKIGAVIEWKVGDKEGIIPKKNLVPVTAYVAPELKSAMEEKAASEGVSLSGHIASKIKPQEQVDNA